MSLAHSPSIVTNGLVFYYDMQNTQKSFKGPPTTNLVTSPDISTYGRTGLVSQPVGGQPDPEGSTTAYKLVANTSSTDFDFVSVPASQPTGAITFSVYMKGAGYDTGSLFLTQSGNNGGIYNFSTGVATAQGTGNTAGMTYVKDGWWRCWVSNPGNTGAGYRIGPSTGALGNFTGDGTSGIFAWRPQVEQTSFMTPWVNGNRSTTQAVMDLTGKNIITANNLTYQSDNTFSFNGTTGYLNNSNFTYHQSTTGSLAAWVYPTQIAGDYYPICVGGTTTFGATRGIRINGNYWSVIGYGSATQDFNSIVLADQNTWAYVVATWNGTTVNFYKNGVKYTDIKSGLITPTGTVLTIGANTWALGSNWPGRIASAQVYNRQLSDDEVQQNFNALKGRFGL